MARSRELTSRFRLHHFFHLIFLLLLVGAGASGCKSSITQALDQRAADAGASVSGSGSSGGASNTGNGSSSGSGSNGSQGGASETKSTLALLADRLQLKSGGSDSVRIVANVRDANNVVSEGSAVTFSASSGALKIENSVTDSTGNAVATLSAPFDATPRQIKVTVKAPGASADLDIAVVGTKLEISGPQNAISAGQTAELEIKLQAGDGAPLKNVPVSIRSALGNALSQSVVVTDDLGQASVTVTDSSGRDDTVTATALNGLVSGQFALKVSQSNSLTFQSLSQNTEVILNTPEELRVLLIRNNVPAAGETVQFFTNRGVFDNDKPNVSAVTDSDGIARVAIHSNQAGGATITARTGSESATATLEFVADAPAVLKLDASPSTVAYGQNSQLTAIVRDANDNLVKNAEVIFHVESDITTGGLKNAGSVKTNSLGRATAVYQAGFSPSGQDGVKIRAYVAGNDSISATTNVTVDPTNVRLIIGTGNEMFEPNPTQYEQPMIVQVSDDGAPVAGADVTILAYPVDYRKGYWEAYDSDLDGKLDAWRPRYTVVCAAEDVNRNGELDTGEDRNGDHQLTPSAVATVVNSVVTTDKNGFAEFKIVYPQNHAMWFNLELVARTTQASGEAYAMTRLVPPAIASDTNKIDQAPPGGSPFGQGGSCNDTF